MELTGPALARLAASARSRHEIELPERRADMTRSRLVGRLGFTLIEMMIAMIITLMIVFAMVEAFRWVGETTTDGRAAIEMLGQIRHVRFRYEDDLSRCTVPLEPWKTDAANYR